MGELVAVEFLSVDGVVQGLGSADEDRDGGFAHGGWGAPYGDVLHEVLDARDLGGTSAYLFGRRTYEKLAAFWPSQPDTDPIAASLNAAPKHVATRTPRRLAWQGSVPLVGDLAEAATRVKSQAAGDVVVLGSGDVVRQLLAADVVDVLRLFTHPLLLGAGKRLFGELPAPRALHLTSLDRTSKGTIAARYARGAGS